MGGQPWKHFEIIVDLLILRNTTRQLMGSVLDDVTRYKQMRFLTVDFNIFAAVPASIWAEFPLLEKLTIVIYPSDDTRETEFLNHYQDPELVKPQRGTIHGCRAVWVLKQAKAAIQAAQAYEMSSWKVPELEVLVRKTGGREDSWVESWWTHDMAEFKKAEGRDTDDEADDETDIDYDSDDSNDESGWFSKARAAMSHQKKRDQEAEALLSS